MNKDLDFEIYRDKHRELAYSSMLRSQRHVVHSRMLPLSLSRADQIYTETGKSFFNNISFPNSIFLLKKATIINPKNTTAQLELAKAFLRLGKVDECFEILKKALSVTPIIASLHELLITEIKKRNGLPKEEKRDHLKDLEAFYKEIENMLADSESKASFYFECAESLSHCQMNAEAAFAYKKSMEISLPTNYKPYYNYGLALYGAGQFEEAIVQFEQVKKLDPSVKKAWNNIAISYYSLGRVEKAREEFLEIKQNRMETDLTNPNFLLVLLHLDEDEELINKYKDLIAQSPFSIVFELPRVYKRELEVTQALIDKNDLDEKTREFHIKKLKGINFLLSFILERGNRNRN